MENKKKIETEITFKALLKNPIRLFGWIYPYLFLVILGIGIFYVKNLTNIYFNSVPVSASDTTNVIPVIEMKKGGISPAVDLNLIKNPTDDFIAKGKELYDNNCQSCHGADGKGDGPAGAVLDPKPRNFYSTEEWTNGRKITDLYKTVEEGVSGTGMVAYEYMTPKDRIAILQYIRTFTDFPEITDEQVTELDNTYNLSEGTVIPNKIPVELAIKKLSEENSKRNKIVDSLAVMIKHDNAPGAKLLSNNVVDIKKVLNTLLASSSFKTLDDFVSIATADPLESGFKAEIVDLSRNQWKEMYDYIIRLIG